MEIKKWWGNYVGGCDDSLLLLDYFMDESELEELVVDCKEINGILTDCIKQM